MSPFSLQQERVSADDGSSCKTGLQCIRASKAAVKKPIWAAHVTEALLTKKHNFPNCGALNSEMPGDSKSAFPHQGDVLGTSNMCVCLSVCACVCVSLSVCLTRQHCGVAGLLLGAVKIARQGSSA